MAKKPPNAAITTATARAGLAPGVHWRALDGDAEAHLGYRKGKRSGVWVVRWRHHYRGANYRQAPIGPANDDNEKKVAGRVTFHQAAAKAKAIVNRKRAEAAAEDAGPVLTVRTAVETYIAKRNERDSRRAGRPVNSDAAQRLSRYVIGRKGQGRKDTPASPLAEVPLHELKKGDLTAWREHLPAVSDASVQRLTNDFKAALNAAWEGSSEMLADLCPKLPSIIKDGLKAVPSGDDDEPPTIHENQILTDGERGRLLHAARKIDAEQEWHGDLYRMILLLAATGQRMSQLARCRVSDLQIKERRLMVPQSRKGKKKQIDYIPVPLGEDVIELLVPCVRGRRPDAPLLERWRHSQFKGSTEWFQDTRGPWQSSSELVRPWQAIRGYADLPHAIPYSFRHTSIVNSIKNNIPLRLVAANHDTSTNVIERHYSRWISSGLEDMVRATIRPLVPADDRKVVQLKQAGA